MNKKAFWEIVNFVSKLGGNEVKAAALEAYLKELPEEDIVGFQIEFEKRMAECDIGDVYGAAKLMTGDLCSDDGFLDFRAWLISLGRTKFEKALKDPDSLASVKVTPLDDGEGASNESYLYAANKAYEQKTGKEIYEEVNKNEELSNISRDLTYDWSAYTDEVLAVKFPKLWKQYQRRLSEPIPALTNTAHTSIKGVQFTPKYESLEMVKKLKPGSKVIHKKYGVGTVLEICGEETDFVRTAKLQFESKTSYFALIDDSDVIQIYEDK